MPGVSDTKNILRCLAHHARGQAVFVKNDLAAIWRLGVAVELHERHGALVHEHGMTACMNKHHGMLGRCVAQRVVNRQTFNEHLFVRFPFVLVPAPPDDPLTRRRLGRCCRNHRHDLGETPCVAEVEDHQRFAKAREVTVAFDETRYHHLAVQVDELGVVAAILRQLFIRADGKNTVALDRDGFGTR